MKYSEKEMAALISEVEAQFSDHLAKAEQTQSKKLNQNKEEVEEKIEKSEKPTISSSEDVNVSEIEDSKLEKNEGNSVDYDEEDLKEVESLYGSMSKSEAEIHYRAVKKAIFGESDIIKSEKDEVIKEESKETTEKLAKSEDEGKKLRKENEELKKSLETLTSTLTNIFKVNKAPKQKAITKIEYIKKSEDEGAAEKTTKIAVDKLSSEEISKRLTSKIRSGSLSKSERDKINAYYNKEISIGEIKDLL